MEELRARFLVLIERRKLLAAVASREHRDWTEAELVELGKLNAALEAIRFTINELSASETPPQPAGPPGASATAAQKGEDDYRMQAAAVREVNWSNFKFSMEQIGQSGRWLLATVAASQFGGLWLLTQLASRLELSYLRPAMWSLVVGITLVLISGLVTYWNWSAGARAYDKLLGPDYLVDPNRWPKVDPKIAKIVAITQWAAIVLGTLSVFCLPIAAYFVSIAHTISIPLTP